MRRKPLQAHTTFFRLTPGVRDQLLKINLTAAEWRIWCYLVSLDPFGDRGAKFIPAELMLKCKIKKTTYFTAKAKFQKLGLFDFRDGVTKVFNLQTSLIQTDSAYSQQPVTIESEISECESEISECESEISECEFGNSECEFGNSDNRSLKPLPGKASKSPQTLQTYSDFIQTLSDSERDNFLKFVEEKTKNLKQPINDLEAWLASKNAAKQNRWEVYYQLFKEQQIKDQSRCNKQQKGARTYTLEEKQRAIARFKAERNRNRPDLNDNPREKPKNNSEEYRQQQAEFNQLLDNPPEQHEKSLAQQRREAIAKAKEQHEAIKRANEKAAEELAKQQNPDLEQRRLEMLRQIEEINQRQQNQTPEINPENLEDE